MTSKLLSIMSKDLLLQKEGLDYLIRSSPHRYKVYQVPKRSRSGMRTIAQPAKEVKRLQYWVIHNILSFLEIHPSAIGYVHGKNIRNNSEPHANNPYLLKLDFKDFFPSIKGKDFLNYAENKNLEFDEYDLKRLVKILFWLPKDQSVLQLSIGAPSSPYLSNLIMHTFDSEISQFCLQERVSYTRYADDMTFSMQKKNLRGLVLQKVFELLRHLSFPQLEINARKTVFGSKAHRRMVTGLILTNNGTISLGRKRKRLLRAQIHHFTNGKLSDKERSKLRGMLSFVRNIEPDFIRRMELKYGHKTINSI